MRLIKAVVPSGTDLVVGTDEPGLTVDKEFPVVPRRKVRQFLLPEKEAAGDHASAAFLQMGQNRVHRFVRAPSKIVFMRSLNRRGEHTQQDEQATRDDPQGHQGFHERKSPAMFLHQNAEALGTRVSAPY